MKQLVLQGLFSLPCLYHCGQLCDYLSFDSFPFTLGNPNELSLFLSAQKFLGFPENVTRMPSNLAAADSAISASVIIARCLGLGLNRSHTVKLDLDEANSIPVKCRGRHFGK